MFQVDPAPPCPLCKSVRVQPVALGRQSTYYNCRTCGHIFDNLLHCGDCDTAEDIVLSASVKSLGGRITHLVCRPCLEDRATSHRRDDADGCCEN